MSPLHKHLVDICAYAGFAESLDPASSALKWRLLSQSSEAAAQGHTYLDGNSDAEAPAVEIFGLEQARHDAARPLA